MIETFFKSSPIYEWKSLIAKATQNVEKGLQQRLLSDMAFSEGIFPGSDKRISSVCTALTLPALIVLKALVYSLTFENFLVFYFPFFQVQTMIPSSF